VRPEDATFASLLQPSSSIGGVYKIEYFLVVNRGFKGLFNSPVGISIPVSLVPGVEQTSGFPQVDPPEFWNPSTIVDQISQNKRMEEANQRRL